MGLEPSLTGVAACMATMMTHLVCLDTHAPDPNASGVSQASIAVVVIGYSTWGPVHWTILAR
jgi:hypothetical protein